MKPRSSLRASLAAGLAQDEMRSDPCGLLRAAGLDEDPWQRAILASRAKQVAILGARQGAGKSTTCAAMALDECLGLPNRYVYIGGPSEDQSKDVVAKVASLIANAGLDVADAGAIKATQIDFRNGSRIRALSSNERTGRGKTAHLLIITEAALATDDLIDALEPSLAVTNGRMILESTPFGKRGLFWRIFDGQVPGWETHKRTIWECTRVTKEFIERQQARGHFYFQQEYECVFHSAIGSIFDADQIDAAFTTGVRPLFPGSQWVSPDYQPPAPLLDERVRPLLTGG